MTCTSPTCNTGLFARNPDVVDFLIRYDQDQTTEAENVAGFERLVESGILHKLSPDWHTEAELILGRKLGR